MDKLIAAFPQNINDALKIAETFVANKSQNEIRNVVICGMGGSGIGGKIVAQWIQDEIKVPVVTCSDYLIPTFVDKYTLVIGSSYSGNTEETIISLETAREKGAHIVGISSGGQLVEFCRTNNYSCVIVPGGNPPRSALAFSLVQLINILVQLDLVGVASLTDLKKAASLLEKNTDEIKNQAYKLAQFLKDKVGIFYAVTRYESVLIRARQQFNENSKLLCWHHTIPEMNHNELVGWGGGDNRFAVVFFDTKDMYPRNKKRFDITLEQVKTKTDNVSVIEAIGANQIEKSLYLIHLVDWSSFYLSELANVDVMDIKVIDYLKDQLSKF